MSQAALTAKYRPQRFASVAGQETLKGILSRAAAEDRIAPAYLFSGTRGVGKTTLARILAKAVNCEHAPAPEPCNECRHCRQITQGSAVDVIEIDGASNRGIEDARRIREDIGYAPMECRYKVFIIDEAHMLTKEASNALLKTLEEPPGNVTFILATTEPHKILPTIVSRCQHYAFRRLTLPGLVAHLEDILQQEAVDYDPRAVQLIARRASGSVRDSMSLLGQALALGRERLEVEDVRSILGLAGSDVFFRVLEAVHGQDPLAVNALLRELLDQGLDLGFFLRELAQAWRNLFLLKQAGEKALPMLELTEEEGGQWLQWANTFSLQHIHAAWQLTLEGQRRVLTSLEPALALELLLLNLTFLPSLVSLDQVGAAAPAAPGTQGSPAGQSSHGNHGQTVQQGRAPSGTPSAQGGPPPWQQPAAGPAAGGTGHQAPDVQSRPRPRASQGAPAQAGKEDAGAEEPEPRAAQDRPPQAVAEGPRSWEGFLDFAQQQAEADGRQLGHLRQAGGIFDAQARRLCLRFMSGLHRAMVMEGEAGSWLQARLQEYFGQDVAIEAQEPDNKPMSRNLCKEELEQDPLVQTLQDELGARIVDWGALQTPES